MASKPLAPRETRVSTLRARKDHGYLWWGCGAREQAHFDPLMPHKLHPSPPRFPATPISPAGAQDPPGEDGAIHSLAWVSSFCSLPIDKGFATDKDGNCGYRLHRPGAGFHRPRAAAHGQPTTGERGSAASHRAGEQNRCPKSGQLSRLIPLEEEHTPQEGLSTVMPTQERAQTQWGAQDQAQGDGPVLASDSTPTG
jgi:hypothetical protein